MHTFYKSPDGDFVVMFFSANRTVEIVRRKEGGEASAMALVNFLNGGSGNWPTDWTKPARAAIKAEGRQDVETKPSFYDGATGLECYVGDSGVRLIAEVWDCQPDTAEAFAKAILDCVKHIREKREGK